MNHKPSDICISSVSYAELIFGVEKSSQPDRNRLALTLLLSSIPVMEFDVNAGDCYGKIRTQLEKDGTSIGAMDLLIAAHCQSLGYTLVTNNVREFRRVKGLSVGNWASEEL